MSGGCCLKWRPSRLCVVSGQFCEAVFYCLLLVAGGDVNGCALHFGHSVLHKPLCNHEPVFWIESHKVGCHEAAVGIVGE
nr:MAG TPA: hypothetical protein [Caudoviricetes sp.]